MLDGVVGAVVEQLGAVSALQQECLASCHIGKLSSESVDLRMSSHQNGYRAAHLYWRD